MEHWVEEVVGGLDHMARMEHMEVEHMEVEGMDTEVESHSRYL